MKTLCILILAFAAAAGAQSTTYAAHNSLTAHSDLSNKEQVEIYWTGDKLFVVSDRKGAVLMTAYKDGHVETSGHFKLRRGARTFWRVMAQYFPAYCAKPALATGAPVATEAVAEVAIKPAAVTVKAPEQDCSGPTPPTGCKGYVLASNIPLCTVDATNPNGCNNLPAPAVETTVTAAALGTVATIEHPPCPSGTSYYGVAPADHPYYHGGALQMLEVKTGSATMLCKVSR